MPAKYFSIALVMCILFISNACAPKPVIMQEDSYGCMPPSSSVFTSNKIDINIAQTVFKNMSVGTLNVKNYPEVISLMNEAAQNNAVRDFYRCLAKKRDGWNDEQLAWQDKMIFFSQTDPKPTPEQLTIFLKENPFPTSHSKVKPDVSCSMEYPIKVENDKVFRNKRNPDIIVKNNGPIKAVALTVDVKIYTYNTELECIQNYVDFGIHGFDFVISAKELGPFDQIKHSTAGVKGKNLIAVYLVDVIFHRESDKEQFSLREYFFTLNSIIYTHDDFKENEHYAKLMKKIQNYEPDKSKTHTYSFTGADDHTWFVESDSMHKVRKTTDGKLRIIGDPLPQGENPRKGFPHLIIHPHRFKGCDCYLKAKIVEDYVEVKIQYRISNVGDAAAGITNNGFDIIKEIEPGREGFHISTLALRKGESEIRPVQDIYDELENDEEMIKMRWTIWYRPKNEPGRLFSVSADHEFTKHSAQSKVR